MSGPQLAQNSKQTSDSPVVNPGAQPETQQKSHNISAVPYFPLPGSVKEFSKEQKSLATRLCTELNSAMDKGEMSLLGALIELQNQFSKTGNTEAAELVRQMHSNISVTNGGSYPTVNLTGSARPSWNNKVAISPFHIAQRKLALSCGLFVNPLTKNRGEMPMLLVALDSSLEFTATTGNKYPVFLHSTKVNTSSYGSCFTGGNAIVNTYTSSLNTLNEAGRVNLVIANELAHAFVEQELGLLFGSTIPGGPVKISFSSDLLDTQAIESLGELSTSNGMQLFETVSDSFSSRVDPAHDTQRLALVYLQLESWAAAQGELGQTQTENNYGLSSNIARAVLESEYRAAGKSEVLNAKLETLTNHHLKYVRLNREGNITEAQKVNRSYAIARARFANEIVEDLGAEGIATMKKVFGQCGESIIATLAARQNIDLNQRFGLPTAKHPAGQQ